MQLVEVSDPEFTSLLKCINQQKQQEITITTTIKENNWWTTSSTQLAEYK